MLGFLEKKKPEKITSFCEYLGLSDEQIKEVEESVKNFIDVGGLRGMHIAQNDYEAELVDSQPEEGSPEDLAQKQRIKDRKDQEEEERLQRAEKMKGQYGEQDYRNSKGPRDVTDEYFENIDKNKGRLFLYW